MANIESFRAQSGRMIKEDGTVVNIAELLEQIAAQGGENVEITSAQITDATVTGKQLLTATDATTARTAIGAGTPYTLPNATATITGGVKQAAHVDPATATVADVVNALVAAGIMAGP